MKNTPINDLDSSQVEELKKQISGEVFYRNTAGYEAARMSWNLLADQHPELIIEAGTAQDIAYTVKFAERNQLKVAVQCTGHGTLFRSDNGILLKTSKMKGIRMNLDKGTVYMEAGAEWNDIFRITQAEGLMPLAATAPSVGVVGFTLNGGFGWLSRKFGPAADSLLAVEMVTMNGELMRITRESQADLFWALAGGGSHFGIVAGIEVKLHPIDSIYSARFHFPVSRATEVLATYRKWTLGLPEELTTLFKLELLPKVPQIPEELQGKPGLMIQGCFYGDNAQAHEFFVPLRALGPILTEEKEMPLLTLPPLVLNHQTR